jgi:hypothetical protein
MKESLSARDREILRIAYEEQFVGLGTLAKFLFGGSIKLASRRVLKLAHLRLLKQEILRLPSSPKVLRLAPVGQRMAKTISSFEIRQKRRVPLSTFEHDASVIHARLELGRRFEGLWVPEKAIKAHNLRKVPDGILVFPSGKRIAIEVENSLKSKSRYRDLWETWGSEGFMVVLYIATRGSIATSLRRLMTELCPEGVLLALVEMDALGRDEVETVWTPHGPLPLFSKRTY